MNTEQRILELRRDGFRTVAQLSEQIGVHKSSIQRQLHKLESKAVVERVYQGAVVFYRLKQSQPSASPSDGHFYPDGAAQSDLALDPAQDRVELAEELVRLERRRLEILEALR